MNDRDPWEGLLDAGEQILWQGQPERGVQLEWRSPFEPLFYLFFTGFSVFWMVMAQMAPGPFWMFGLLFFGIGIYNLAGMHFWTAWRRQGTFYTLTDKRAFIGTDIGGRRKLESYPILPSTQIWLDEGRYANVWFAEHTKRGRNGTTTTPIGFERLKDGRAVFAKLREIQAAPA
ncbi:MAG: aspartate carbamoyltransferase catalytic subunit [Pseudomonadota bacterium]